MNYDLALKLLKKYGFNSINDSPYLSCINNRFGVAIKYIDRCFGKIERTFLFDDEKKMDAFLKLYRRYLDYGKRNEICIQVDDYRVMFPNVVFVKEGKLVLNEELLEGLVSKEKCNNLEKLKIVARNLLNYYLDLSSRQVEYINKVNVMKNILINKERILQEELRKIKKGKKEVKVTAVKEEVFKYDDSLYRSYEEYLNKVVTEEHAKKLIVNLWNFNKKLEYSNEYYDSLANILEIGKKIKIVDNKIAYVKSLKGKNLLLVNVNANLKQIEVKYDNEKIDLSFKDEQLDKVKKKYELFDKISIYYLDDYLKEAYLYDNYDYLANKYKSDNSNRINKDIINELRKSYQLLSFNERRVLTLFNSKYKNIFDLILEIPDFSEWSNKKMTKYLEGIESVSRFKEECIDELCVRLVQEINKPIREKYFIDINFKSFKFFVQDMVNLLIGLKNINDKMILDGDIQLFMEFNNISSLKSKYVYYLSDNSNSIVYNAITKKHTMGVFKVLNGSPVLYSPYSLDFGDLYDKNSRRIMEASNSRISLVVDVNDVKITRDKKISEVYYFENRIEEKNGINVVTDIRYRNKLNYYNFTICKR